MGRVAGALLLLGAACGDDMMTMAPVPLPVVSLQAEYAPVLLAFRLEAEAAWQSFTGATTVDVAVAGPYRVAWVCSAQGAVVVHELARTPGDGDTVALGCGDASAPFTIAGELAVPGAVALGTQTVTTTGEFELQTRPGVFDLVMLTGDRDAGFARVAVQRALRVGFDQRLGMLDAAGAPPCRRR